LSRTITLDVIPNGSSGMKKEVIAPAGKYSLHRTGPRLSPDDPGIVRILLREREGDVEEAELVRPSRAGSQEQGRNRGDEPQTRAGSA
jgi:hypothetical protein